MKRRISDIKVICLFAFYRNNTVVALRSSETTVPRFQTVSATPKRKQPTTGSDHSASHGINLSEHDRESRGILTSCQEVPLRLSGTARRTVCRQKEDIKADVFELAEAVDGGDPALVEDLVNHKRTSDEEFIPDDLEERARTAIQDQFNTLGSFIDPDKVKYRSAIDDWIRK